LPWVLAKLVGFFFPTLLIFMPCVLDQQLEEQEEDGGETTQGGVHKRAKHYRKAEPDTPSHPGGVDTNVQNDIERRKARSRGCELDSSPPVFTVSEIDS
jgi:hypothetical protein